MKMRKIYKIALTAILVVFLIATAGLVAKDRSGEKIKETPDASGNFQGTSARVAIATAVKAPLTDSTDSLTEIEWTLFSAGGIEASSEDFGVSAAMGEIAVGFGSSENFGMSQGFIEIVESTCCRVAGDANNDGACNIGDEVFLGNYIFRAERCDDPPGNPIGCPPNCLAEGDANADGNVNVGDEVFLGNYIFRPPPASPAPQCGPEKK